MSIPVMRLRDGPMGIPITLRQRYRWMYGNIQAMWKHRGLMFNPRYGWLGMLSLPLAAISVVMPLIFLPFVYVMAVVMFEAPGLDLLLYAAIFLVAQLISAVAGV